mgnify:CR=1 FL=1
MISSLHTQPSEESNTPCYNRIGESFAPSSLSFPSGIRNKVSIYPSSVFTWCFWHLNPFEFIISSIVLSPSLICCLFYPFFDLHLRHSKNFWEQVFPIFSNSLFSSSSSFFLFWVIIISEVFDSGSISFFSILSIRYFFLQMKNM